MVHQEFIKKGTTFIGSHLLRLEESYGNSYIQWFFNGDLKPKELLVFKILKS